LAATLHLDTGREMRGGQWQVFHLLEGLTKAGHHCTLLARPGSPLLDRARAAGLDARPLRLREIIRLAPSYNLVHAHDARAHTLASFLGRPLVVSRRVAFPLRGSPGSRWKYSRASRYIAVSNYVKSILAAAGISEDKIDVVNDGVPLPPEPRFEGRSTIVAIDSSDPGKGKSLIQDAARRAQVEVLFSKDLPADLKSAALFIYVTESEGLGSAALLAMAAGVPVLASAAGGLPEVIEDGVTGLLMRENSSARIADAMLGMLRDRTHLAQLGRNARERVERDFTTEHMVQNTLRVYERVLA